MSKQKRQPHAIYFDQPSRTQQQFADDANVNTIVRRFAETGVDPYASRAEAARYGFATSIDFKTAMDNVAEVNSAFAQLPAKTRAEFDNDPAAWLSAQIDQIPGGPEDPEIPSGDPEPPEEVSEPENPPPEGANQAE